MILNEIETEYTNDTMQIILKIYDVSNDEQIQNIEIIKKCQIFFLVYDLNNNQTLKQVETLIKDIHKYKKEKKDKKKVLIVIIGNKKDLADKKNIINNNKKKNNKDEGKDLSNKYKTLFFKVSALDDKEIKNIIGIAIENYINLP